MTPEAPAPIVSRHTPGPWSAAIYRHAAFVMGGDGDDETKVADIGPVYVIDERDANARLIAAAPDLLSAARFGLSVLKEMRAVDTSERMAVEKLSKAVADATGWPACVNCDSPAPPPAHPDAAPVCSPACADELAGEAEPIGAAEGT